jgi:hypothetical protein
VRERWRRRRASREQITRRRGCRWVVRSYDDVPRLTFARHRRSAELRVVRH